MNKRKGVDILIEAIIKLNKIKTNRKYEFIFAGQGEITIPNIPNIKYCGFLEGPEYSNLFKESHVFILPSRSDGYGVVTIEALSSGNVLILSDAVGSTKETISSNGRIFKSEDIDDLLDKLLFFINSEKQSLIQMAKESISLSYNFSHQKSANKFATIIRNTCQITS
jgi:glycosyltransferase involved in cell wall biosynthesis